MRVLWITNLPLHSMKKNDFEKSIITTQSWLTALKDEMINKAEIELGIATIMENPQSYKVQEGNIVHYAIKSSLKSRLHYPMPKTIKKEWTKIIEDFNPDIIHYHGTEFSHGLTLHEIYPNIPSVLSIQGLTTIIERHYYANISPYELLKRKTLYNLIFGGIPQKKKEFLKRGIYEREFIQSVKNVVGRTDWDKSFVKSLNPKVNYFHCEEAMRSDFFRVKWDIKEIKRYTIFTPASYNPIKGFHFLLEAVAILREKYPKIKLRVMGPNITKSSTIKEKLLQTDYALYLRDIIKKHDLGSNIEFLGPLSSNQIAREMKSSHTVVVPSAIENGCNVLAEAMLIGVPSVASSAGGMTTTLKHDMQGYSYNYTEIEMLAYYVSKIWSNDSIALRFSEAARKSSVDRYNPKNVCLETFEIYMKLLNE